MLKVSSMKEVVCFDKRGKLSPQYVGSYEIVEVIGPISYQLDLPIEMQGINDVFHISSLKKSLGEKRPVVVEPSSIPLQHNLSYEE